MSDRSNSPGQGRGTTSTSLKTGASPQQDEPRTSEARPGRHLRLVEKAPAEPAAGADNTPGRRSHLARLVEALHASRRIQAAQVTRRYLHLVQ